MNRRNAIVLGGGALVAVGAGIATALLRRPPPAGAGDQGAADFQTEFERPSGGKLALADFSGKPLLLNFWATWCAPCVREMPLLDRFANEQRAAGWHVVGLAIDRIEPVREFLAKHPVDYPVAVAGTDALAWLRSLGNPGGGLPFSVAYNSAGVLSQRKIGEIGPQELATWVAAVR